ncbi:FAD-dependent oxidoreductase [uncultured Marinobacter sp.]|uniref:NAD(P)/FAD-dependent oxidoreductase n=1 Tax=uncultured Marinobacter sp. TaxID=187379 RepID=UPI0030DC4170
MTSETREQSSAAPIVIVGSGLAGYSLAREFRKLDTDTPLMLITADDGTSYSKPMLSTGFSKGKTAAELAQADAGAMAEQLQMDIRTSTRITGIDTDAHELQIGSERLPYRKLVLATGAEVITLDLSGSGAGEVLSINDLSDYQRFRERLPEAGRVVILGAGLIGCEFANDLRNGGYQVSLVAPSVQVMPGLLPDEAAGAVQDALAQEGVSLHLGTTAERIDRIGTELSVTLASGEVLTADLVVSAVGLRPRTALARAAGLSTGHGIAVNRAQETSAPDVYALGDGAEVDGLVLMYVLPLMASARALAKTLAGERTEVRWGAMPVMVKTPCCPTAVCPPLSGAEGSWESQRQGNSVKAVFRDAGGRLLGFALTGDAALEKQALTRELPPIHS